MDFVAPFQPAGPMLSLLGSSSNSTAATLLAMQGPFTLLAFNRSAATDAYLVYGPNSGVVSGTVLPAVGAFPPSTGGPNLLPMPFRTSQTFTFQGPTFVGILIPGTGNAIIDITVGDGS